ncbi:MAG: ABC transporter permease [Oscillospiraceae bacterium]|nr:ABC transporter permease [Oscillospiraceae bacterium]
MGGPTGTKRKLAAYLSLFLLLCVFSLVAGKLAPHDAEFVDLAAAKQAPGGAYPLGTDGLGRCIWSRILAGASSSIFASLVIVVISLVVGCAVGIVSGYAGGVIDEIVMRVVDVFLAFPGIVLSIAVAGMLGPGLKNGVLALAATGWTQYARLTRSYVLSLRQENYVRAARLNGQTGLSILIRHILPNAIRPVAVTGTLHLSGAMLGISGLSFLGLSSSSAEWGSMLSEGRSLMQQCPWAVLYPALAIFLVTILFNLLGDSVRDVLDPSGAENTLKD